MDVIIILALRRGLQRVYETLIEEAAGRVVVVARLRLSCLTTGDVVEAKLHHHLGTVLAAMILLGVVGLVDRTGNLVVAVVEGGPGIESRLTIVEEAGDLSLSILIAVGCIHQAPPIGLGGKGRILRQGETIGGIEALHHRKGRADTAPGEPVVAGIMRPRGRLGLDVIASLSAGITPDSLGGHIPVEEGETE